MIRSLLATLCAAGLLNTVVLADDVTEIVLHPAATNPLMYDKTALTAKVGQKIKLTLENKSAIPQPHNFMLLKPGTKDKVIALANMMLTDPNAMAKQYIPESPDILYHTNLIQPGQTGSIEFTITEPGAYPYLCTFPGHSILMNGVLTVEK
jgi:azurin